MKLNYQGLRDTQAWTGYRLPTFDIAAMVRRTLEEPIWLHIGAGNIFRAFPAVMQQDLLEAGLADRGVIVCESYDEAIIPTCYTPHDHLSLLVTLKANGQMEKRVVASVADAFNAADAPDRLTALMASPSLQMVSFTITEKGYAVATADGKPMDFIRPDIDHPPAEARTVMGRVAAGLWARYQANATPLALLSMDNCAQNGEKLAKAVRFIADHWLANGFVDSGFMVYLQNSVACPWSMIDKITPRPSDIVAKALTQDGYEDAQIVETAKHTFIASFVNAEACQYLVIEDHFPNGRPPLEKAGALLTNRETVQKTEQMKVCTCLNPLHTAVAIAGQLLNYPSIAACMQDPRLVGFVKQIVYTESLPVVVHPGVIDPETFLHEVLTERLPNPFIPDTPARISCDASQKIPVRFGETLKARLEAGLPVEDLTYIPLFFALWLRYLLAVDDKGQPMTLSPDPRLAELTEKLSSVRLGDTASAGAALQSILSDASLFGVDLYAEDVQLGEKVENLFHSLAAEAGAVGRMLDANFL